MPFLSPMPATRMQRTHFHYLDWGVLELSSKEKELVGVKNAQASALLLLAFQNSLCLVNTSHCCSPSAVLKFALATMLTIDSLMGADLQISPSNFGLVG